MGFFSRNLILFEFETMEEVDRRKEMKSIIEIEIENI